MNIIEQVQKEVVNELLGKNVSSPTQEFKGKHIAILQRGWIYVGDLEKDGPYFTLKNASCVRRWGTDKGIGELAENGPLKKHEVRQKPRCEIS